MKNIKKFLFSIVAMAMLVSTLPNIVMANTIPDSEIAPITGQQADKLTVNDFLVESLLRGTSKPTQFHDLASSNYKATIEIMKVSTLYTNYYFKPNASGEIYITPSFEEVGTGNPSNLKFTIRLYDKTTNTLATSYTGNDTGRRRFYNLDKTHEYYFAFTNEYAIYQGQMDFSISSEIRGTALITH